MAAAPNSQLPDVTPCGEHAQRLKAMETVVESLKGVPASVERLVRAIVGDEEMGTPGLVDRVVKLEVENKSLRDSRIWVLGAAAGIGFLASVAGSALTVYKMMQ